MTGRSKIFSATIAAVVAGSLSLSACGSSDSSSDDTSSQTDTPSNTSGVSTTEATPTTSAAQSKRPAITVPTAPAPTTLQSSDVSVGTGATAKTGDTVNVQYVGANYADGKEFDASWNRGEPFTFQLGAGSVIKGWDQGVVGMKVGGRRQLVIPPSLGYGNQANGPIVANETLIFVVDLISIG